MGSLVAMGTLSLESVAMPARRLLIAIVLTACSLASACDGGPTAVTAPTTMQNGVDARKDQIPWH
jgi:hypothetical protein